MEKVDVEERVEFIRQAVMRAGIRLTPQRLEIFRLIAASEEHPSAEALYRVLKPRMPMVSLDTVYRTLWMLNDLGLVSTLGQRRDGVRFDANLAPHHHYVCVRCGMVRDFNSAELNELRIPDSVASFGSIVAAHVEVRGVCGHCASALAGESDKDMEGLTANERRGERNE